MYINQISEDNFILLKAKYEVSKARQLIERLDSTHIIVHRTESEDSEKQDYYYLYQKEEALEKLEAFPDTTTIFEAFDLHEYTSTLVFDAFSNVEEARGEEADFRFVIMDEGRVTGFFDPDALAMANESGTSSRRRHLAGKEETKPEKPVPRSLVADFPEEVQLDKIASLLVYISIKSKKGASLPVVLPVDTKEIDIVIQPKKGFQIEGESEGSIVVSDDEETLPLQFKLKATDLGLGRVRIFAFQKGQPIGTIDLAPQIVPPEEDINEQRISHEQTVDSISVHQPDLSLMIFESESGGKPTFTIRISARDARLKLNLKPFGPIQLRVNPQEYFDNFFEDIEDLPLNNARQGEVAEKRLAAKGSMLFEKLFPEDLQALLWSLRDRIKTIQVSSEEPWIPWELCKIQGIENGKVIEGPFLCESFAITRWRQEIGHQPRLKLKNVALVVPNDSVLSYAKNEKEFLLSLKNRDRHVETIPATFLDVQEALAKGEYDTLHFSGHGSFRDPDPNSSKIILENQEDFTPENISGVVKNLGLAQPLVFLNACQVGRNAISLVDIGGWAEQFLNAGASAFIGSYWSIFDKAAFDFAQSFYNYLLAGKPIGQATLQARTDIKSTGDPTWLAYTVFADPLASVES